MAGTGRGHSFLDSVIPAAPSNLPTRFKDKQENGQPPGYVDGRPRPPPV